MKQTSIRGLWLSLLGLQSRLFGLLALSRVSKVVEQLPSPNTYGSKILIVGGGNIDNGELPDFLNYDLICFSNSSLSLNPHDQPVPIVWFFSPAFQGDIDTVQTRALSAICVGNPPRWSEDKVIQKVSSNEHIHLSDFSIISERDKKFVKASLYKGFQRFVWLSTGMTALLWAIENKPFSRIEIIGYDLYEDEKNPLKLGHCVDLERLLLNKLIESGRVQII